MGTYTIGLYNADMLLNEKGYYLAILLYGLFAAIAVQKNVRDLAMFKRIDEHEVLPADGR